MRSVLFARCTERQIKQGRPVQQTQAPTEEFISVGDVDNHMYDYIAFGYFIGERRTCNLYFMDDPSLQSLFEKRYEVLTVYQLEEPLVRQAKDSGKIILNTDDANEIINRDNYCDNYILLNENELNDVELHYVNYFWSHTVGELVFNYWD